MTALHRPEPSQLDELLVTKLIPPPSSSALVIPRDHLRSRLEEGLVRKLTLVSAPAGFGKTTLVSQWVNEHQQPAAWISLDAHDSDPVRFWRYIVTAFQSLDTSIGKATLPLLNATPQPSFERFLSALVNHMVGWTNRHVLVMDDFQTIESRTVDETLAFLLDHLPPTLHITLITRRDPELPLGRLRVRNELTELRREDLELSTGEIRRFVEQRLQVTLSTNQIERLEARTEGWGAGLQLIAYALQGKRSQDIDHVVKTFSGSHQHFIDYLVGDVLAAQPENIQQFLLQTSILRRFNSPLCNAVVKCDNSQEILLELERGNLFVIPLSGEGATRWYRYHSLFSEAMRHEAAQRLGDPGLQELLKRASIWYEQQGFLEEAIEASLDAHSFARAARMVQYLLESRSFNEIHTLRRWLERLPKDILSAHPLLAFHYAMTLLYTSDRRSPAVVDQVEAPLHIAELSWQQAGNRARLGQLMTCRATIAFWQNDLERTFALAQRALELLPESDAYWRGTALLFHMYGKLLAGHIDEAHSLALEARAICEASQNSEAALAATLLYGDVCYWNGQLHQAAQIYQHVVIVAEHEDDPSDRAWARLGLGRLHYEWNDLETAREYGLDVAAVLKEVSQDPLLALSEILLARIAAASGHTEEAQKRLTALIPITAQWPEVHREILAWQARLWLSSGNQSAVEQWQLGQLRHYGTGNTALQELEALTTSRWHIAHGRIEEAVSILEPWEADADEHGRVRSKIEIQILLALAHYANRDLSRATTALIRALEPAKGGDYRRLFLDEGEPLGALIQVYLANKDAPYASYARVLLYTALQEQTEFIPARTQSALLEPLSARERRVLRLIAAGLSNPEIAEELIVSVNTVKTQVRSIYYKLGVRNREQAREAAHDLHLL